MPKRESAIFSKCYFYTAKEPGTSNSTELQGYPLEGITSFPENFRQH